MKLRFLVLLIVIFSNGNTVSGHLDLIVPDHKHVFDLNLFESVLDPELCDEQIKYIQQNDQELLLEFLDAGIRTPRGIFTGNVLDLGNYYQCLAINRQIPNSVIEGKYCMIDLPLDQNWPSLSALPDNLAEIPWPDGPWLELNPKTSRLKENVAKRVRDFDLGTSAFAEFNGGRTNTTRIADTALASLTFHLAICIPKSCSTHTALKSFLNTTELSFIEFEESFCRLPNDKQWVTGEYVALAIFSLFGLLVVLSTLYDIHHNVYLHDQKRPVNINKLYLAFSAYKNTRRLVTYVPVPGTIECLDGIRSIAMMWVVIGHTYANQLSSGIMANPLDTLDWMTSLKSIWITAGTISVDTFFTLSGLLLVYSTAGKLTSMKLLKNLHLFYLNRLLRMFPVLAATILLQISVFSRVADGPYWLAVNQHTHRCRVLWWTTILYVQNYLNPGQMCLAHSWYLAIDMQLHILSPIILFWVLTGKRRIAWTGLICGMLAVLISSTTYNFIKNFPPGPIIPSRPLENLEYTFDYYVFTLTRASPFIVGMIFGYILHLNRGKKVVISWILVTLLWVCSLTIAALIIYSPYPIMQLDWDNQLADNMINSFMRPAWAMFLGWLIFACAHGYGGPVNWLLSLRAWKLLSRLSYAIYLVHYPMTYIINNMPVVPTLFDVKMSFFKFLGDFSLAVIVAFLVTIVFDSPCSIFIKHFMGGGPKRSQPKHTVTETSEEKETE